jgi:hypothetical protein
VHLVGFIKRKIRILKRHEIGTKEVNEVTWRRVNINYMRVNRKVNRVEY